jgi:hypothetical protein
MIECATNSKLNGFAKCLRRLIATMYQQQPSGLVDRRGIPTDGRGGGVRRNRIPKTIHQPQSKNGEGCRHRRRPIAMHSHRRRDAQQQQHAPSSNSNSSNSSTTIRRWRWLALALVISWNENLAIVNGTTSSSSSSLRRTSTTTGGADETLAELEREELLDTTVDNTSHNNPAGAVPAALLDTSSSSERPLGEATRPIEKKHAEPAAQQIEKKAAVPMPPPQQHPPKSYSSSSLSPSNSTAATRDEQQFLDDDDRLFQQPRPSDIIYQKSPSSNFFLVPWVAALGLIGMVFTAWQMADYPDGFYAGLCRLIFGSIQFLLYILTTPYRIICYYCCGRRTAGGHEPYGRISTMEYGYSSSGKNNTNPALELS